MQATLIDNSDLWGRPSAPGARPGPRRGPTPLARSIRVDREIRLRETREDMQAFQDLVGAIYQTMGVRVFEAVVMRALRRWAVEHQDLILEAAAAQPYRGRELVEEDFIKVLEQSFPREQREAPPRAAAAV